jgi:hypothetical protein
MLKHSKVEHGWDIPSWKLWIRRRFPDYKTKIFTASLYYLYHKAWQNVPKCEINSGSTGARFSWNGVEPVLLSLTFHYYNRSTVWSKKVYRLLQCIILRLVIFGSMLNFRDCPRLMEAIVGSIPN